MKEFIAFSLSHFYEISSFFSIRRKKKKKKKVFHPYIRITQVFIRPTIYFGNFRKQVKWSDYCRWRCASIKSISFKKNSLLLSYHYHFILLITWNIFSSSIINNFYSITNSRLICILLKQHVCFIHYKLIVLY